MNPIERFLAPLRERPIAGYLDEGPPATEVTSLAALALATQGCWDAARTATDWLRRQQSDRGSLGISPEQSEPGWATGWAVIAWSVIDRDAAELGREVQPEYVQKAVAWILKEEGVKRPRVPEVGHDPSLSGWSWVAGTHAWIEPTAMNVLALRHVGLDRHERVRQGVKVLLDRQLPTGGCNYGNTMVLGQYTLPHVQPTALSLLALVGEPPHPAIERSVAYLRSVWPEVRGLASLCFAAMTLAAYGHPPSDLHDRIDREMDSGDYPISPYLRALAVLAFSLPSCPLLVSDTGLRPEGSLGQLRGRVSQIEESP